MNETGVKLKRYNPALLARQLKLIPSISGIIAAYSSPIVRQYIKEAAKLEEEKAKEYALRFIETGVRFIKYD